MPRRFSCRQPLVLAAVVCMSVLFASPGFAQMTLIKGKVVDAAGKPLEKAKVLIENKESSARKYEVTTNKKGEFIQIGLPSGTYKVTADFKDLGSQTFDVPITLSRPGEVNFILGAPGGELSKEAAAKNAAIKKTFDDGVLLSKDGKYDEAIAKFNEAATLVPSCADCFYNVGYAYSQKKEWDAAETAFNKAIELKAGYIDAYNGLATVYNAQKKFDKATEASKKASELASAGGAPGGTAGVDAQYNQGVILWNAGKIDEARAAFEEVVKMKPDHADAHYQLGMANLNQGKLPEAVAMFEKYLELAPTGQYAVQAKGILSQIKK